MAQTLSLASVQHLCPVLIPKVTAWTKRQTTEQSWLSSSLGLLLIIELLQPCRRTSARCSCCCSCRPLPTVRASPQGPLNWPPCPVTTKLWRNCLVWLWPTSMRTVRRDTSLPWTALQTCTCTLRLVQKDKVLCLEQLPGVVSYFCQWVVCTHLTEEVECKGYFPLCCRSNALVEKHRLID